MNGTPKQASSRLLALLFFGVSGAASLGCGGPAFEAQSPGAGLSDEKLILKQELGELPAPQGPCPERTQPNVLGNPRAPVQRTALGLAYCMLKEGPPGNKVPSTEDTVRVLYTGWTEEGKMFDSAVESDKPLDVPLNAVIRGWTEGLRLMTPGDKARLWIAGNLGYGRRAPGEDAGTPPKGTLIFDIELLDVLRASAPAAPPPPEAEARPGLAPRPLPAEPKRKKAPPNNDWGRKPLNR
jgi:hypothetical protein